MRISVAHSFYRASAPSGENVAVLQQIQALRHAGHEVGEHFLHTDVIREAQTLYPIRAAFRTLTGYGTDPVDAAIKSGAEVLHVHNLFPNFGWRSLRRADIPLVYTAHNFRFVCAVGTFHRKGKPCFECLDASTFRGVLHRCYENSAVRTFPLSLGISRADLLREPDIVVTMSERSAGLLMRAGVTEDRIRIVPNFAEQNTFHNVSRTPRRGWVYAGRLEPEKGVVELIDAWPTALELTIAGSGSLSEVVRTKVEKKSNMVFRGNMPRAEVLALLAGAEGLVFPSLWTETAPAMTYVDALSVATPTLALTGNAVADDVRKRETGVTFDRFDQIRASVTQMQRVSEELRARCEEVFRQEYSRLNWVKRMIRVYQEVT